MSRQSCPVCGSTDIDMEFTVCRSCNTYLPTGSFDVRPRFRTRRSGMRAATGSHVAAKSDKRTESIIGREL